MDDTTTNDAAERRDDTPVGHFVACDRPVGACPTCCYAIGMVRNS